MKNKRLVTCVVALMFSIMAVGCSMPKINSNTKIILTTGFKKNEVFRIEKASCTLPEVMVYLTNSKNQYENTFGSQIWEVSYEGENIADNIKETVLARLARIKAMNLMAHEYGVELDEAETEKASKAASDFYEKLKQNERELLGVDGKLIRDMYSEYALANKMYEFLIADINPEISDDEARTITVEHIFFKTYSLNESGERVKNSIQSIKESYDKAREALQRAKDGENFATLITEYSDDSKSTYSFGKGIQEAEFERVAFNLGTGEISDIVETEYGYHIIRCISKFDRNETDINKKKIVEQRRREVFNEKYSEFVADLTKNMNKELWEKVGFIEDDTVEFSNFFEIYDKYFETAKNRIN